MHFLNTQLGDQAGHTIRFVFCFILTTGSDSVQFSFYILLFVPCQIQHGSLSILFSRLEDVVIGSSCCSHELCVAMTMSLESDSDWCSDTVCMKPSLQFNCPLRIPTLIFYTGSILQTFLTAKSPITLRSFF